MKKNNKTGHILQPFCDVGLSAPLNGSTHLKSPFPKTFTMAFQFLVGKLDRITNYSTQRLQVWNATIWVEKTKAVRAHCTIINKSESEEKWLVPYVLEFAWQIPANIFQYPFFCKIREITRLLPSNSMSLKYLTISEPNRPIIEWETKCYKLPKNPELTVVILECVSCKPYRK